MQAKSGKSIRRVVDGRALARFGDAWIDAGLAEQQWTQLVELSELREMLRRKFYTDRARLDVTQTELAAAVRSKHLTRDVTQVPRLKAIVAGQANLVAEDQLRFLEMEQRVKQLPRPQFGESLNFP